MVCNLELKRRSYGCLKTNTQSWAGISQLRRHLEGCLAAAKPPLGIRVPLHSTVRPFRSCEMGCKNPPPLQNPPSTAETISKLQKWDAIYFFIFLFSFWLPNGCKMISKLQNDFQALKWAAEMFFFFPLGCKMISKLQNDLQAIKMTCKMKRGLRKHLAKPREIAKMPTKPRNHAFKEESPLTEITHTKPLTPFLIS